MLSFRPFALLLLCVAVALTGCQTNEWAGIQGVQTPRFTPQMLSAEPAGDYWIGRRYYKADYKFWGYVRRPGQPWTTAKLVMMNEQQKLAPDRAEGHIGSDNGYEYKLVGDFSGESVYEPASNSVYPEFVLKSYELKSISPPRIFSEPGALDPRRRIIAKPR
jgi:hypothetical protein